MSRPPTTTDRLLEVLTAEWKPWSEILEETAPIPWNGVSSAMYRLRKKGLVESLRASPKTGHESMHRLKS